MSVIDPDLQLHLRRSQCIDAFVTIEFEIAVLMAQLCPGHEPEVLAQKIKRLKDLPAGPQYSKKQRANLHEILAQVELILPLRHDIVHGSLSVLKASDVTVAAFVNVREAIRLGSPARLFTDASLELLARDAKAHSARLKGVLAKTPPSPS